MYEPIPFDISYTSTDVPTITMNVGGIEATCAPGACDYEAFNESIDLKDYVYDPSSGFMTISLEGNENNIIG